MKLSIKTALAAAAAVATLAGATAASADVACNRYGECWRVRERYTTYPTNLGVRFYDDAWAAAHRRGYHWRRDRDDDHGYWYHNRWRAFH